MALSWGVIVAYAQEHALDIAQPSPRAIKLGVAGQGGSKGHVQKALMTLFGPRQTTGLLRTRGILGADFNHAFDALGAAVVSVPDNDGQLFRTSTK